MASTPFKPKPGSLLAQPVKDESRPLAVTVWVATYYVDSDPRETRVYTSKAGTDRWKAEIARANWDDMFNGDVDEGDEDYVSPPELDEEAASDYFSRCYDNSEGEWYDVTECVERD